MKKAVCLVLALITVSCLAACQPTPEKAAVADKTGELEKKIMQAAVPHNQMLETVPEKWEEEVAYQSGVKLIINAEIEMPDAKSYPVIEAVPHKITLEEAKNYIEILTLSQPVYEIGPRRVKSDWEQEILQVMADIESVNRRKDLTKDMRQQYIKGLNEELEDLKERYDNAPDKRGDRAPANMSFKHEADTRQVLGVEADLGQATPAIVSIAISDDNMENILMFYDGSGDGYSIDIYADMYAGMALSPMDAQEKAEQFLQGLGIDDMQLKYTEIRADPGRYMPNEASFLANDPGIKKCYVLHFCPVIHEIPVTLNRFYYGLSSNTENYDKIWKAHTVMIYVNDSDVYRMDWYGMDDLGQVLNENIELLEFEEVKEIFDKQIFYQRTWDTQAAEDTTIHVKKVQLGMMRIRLKENRYVYLPVWDFIGDWTYVSDGTESGMYDVSFLTINAIDGSIIDRDLGY